MNSHSISNKVLSILDPLSAWGDFFSVEFCLILYCALCSVPPNKSRKIKISNVFPMTLSLYKTLIMSRWLINISIFTMIFLLNFMFLWNNIDSRAKSAPDFLKAAQNKEYFTTHLLTTVDNHVCPHGMSNQDPVCYYDYPDICPGTQITK